jgi:hypothetical protein
MALAAVLVALVIFAALGVAHQANRATASFIGGDWSEGPLLLELHRMQLGEPGFTPPAAVNAYDYGPVYVAVLNALRAAAGFHNSVRTFRMLTIWIGLFAALPLGYAAAAVSRRAGYANRAAAFASAAAAGAFGVAVLAHNVTFARLHPDNLTFVLVAAAIALHFGIAARMLGPRFAWSIVAFALAATFTKQNCGAVAPLLLAGLACAGAISLRLFASTVAAYALLVAAAIAAMPADMRAWTVLIPLAHRYEFTPDKFGGGLSALTWAGPYLGATFLLFLALAFVVRAKAGARALWVDAAALAAVASAALSAYFKQLGIINDLTLLGAATLPYAGAALGALYAAGRAGSARSTTALLALGAALALSLATHPDDSRPTLSSRDERNVARTKVLAAELCAGGRTILVVAPLEEFFACRAARFALAASFTELRLAYPRFDAGPTALSRVPDTDYVVGPEDPEPPDAWLAHYHRVHPRIAEPAAGLGRLHVAVYRRNG